MYLHVKGHRVFKYCNRLMFVPRLLTPGYDVNFRCGVEVVVEPVSHRRGLLGQESPRPDDPLRHFTAHLMGETWPTKRKTLKSCYIQLLWPYNDGRRRRNRSTPLVLSCWSLGTNLLFLIMKIQSNLSHKNKNVCPLSIMSSK